MAQIEDYALIGDCETDFMPPKSDNSRIVRIIKGLEGKVEMRRELAAHLDYGGEKTLPSEGKQTTTPIEGEVDA
jgi:hypothetical protein